MDWKQIVGKVAPALGMSLGGPLGAAALGALANALGCDSSEAEVAKAVQSATPEQLAAIQAENHNFTVKMTELGLKPEEMAAADRASARDRQVKAGDHTPQILAYLYSAGFFSLLGMEIILALAHVDIPANVLRSLDVATGVLFAFVLATKDFFFGASASSAKKDEHMIHMWDTTP